MNFFFDRCIPIALARMVSALEVKFHKIVHHDADSRFNELTEDVQWMRAIGSDSPKPIVLSGDGRILKKSGEVNTLRELGWTFFLFGEDFEQMQYHLQAWKFMKAWPEVLRECRKVRQASVFKVCTGSSQKIEFLNFTKDLPQK